VQAIVNNRLLLIAKYTFYGCKCFVSKRKIVPYFVYPQMVEQSLLCYPSMLPLARFCVLLRIGKKYLSN
jgi:hypothetical protein